MSTKTSDKGAEARLIVSTIVNFTAVFQHYLPEMLSISLCSRECLGNNTYLLQLNLSGPIKVSIMKCAKLRLQERSKVVSKPTIPDKPRRYCQKRLVNPDHEEDPRWIDIFQRFHCNAVQHMDFNGTYNTDRAHQEYEDLFLSVQNLKFQGDEQHRKRPRTSFKYKTPNNSQKHRMFVKQMVEESDHIEDDRESQLTCYYYDDYAKYLQNADRSRPSSGKSSIFLHGLSSKFRENKATQVDTTKTIANRKAQKFESRLQKLQQNSNLTSEQVSTELPEPTDDTKIAFQKSGKRKSLTISRAQSPETVQVIRVEVVCNYSSSSAMSDYEDNKRQMKEGNDKFINKVEQVTAKNSHFTNKYLLTNTVKTLDERVSGGDKVTLLCKTFRLSDRSKVLSNKKSVKSSVKS